MVKVAFDLPPRHEAAHRDEKGPNYMKKAMCILAMLSVIASWSAVFAQTAVEREATRIATQEKADRLPDMTVGAQESASELLRKRVASVDWTDKTFEEVLDWLRDQGEGRVNIVARWGPLQIESVSRETAVSLKLNNTTVADVMNEVLGQLSADGQIHYRGIGNGLTISTKQDFERKMFVRVYNIADLLFRVPNFGENAPLIDLQNAGKSSGGGGGGGGGGGRSVFSGGSSGSERGAGGQQEEQENQKRLTELRTLIEQTIAPETWDLSGSQSTSGATTGGGGRGRIRVINTSLVVLNTIEVHEMITGKFSFAD